VTTNGYSKSLPELIAELKGELRDFIATRVAMLQAEMRENLKSLKLAVPGLLMGLVLLWTAWLVLTAFLVTIIAHAFTPQPWAYVVAFLIVGVLYALFGGFAAMSAWKQIKQRGLKPGRTIRVLKEDRIWIQAESKVQS
jgi:uncharacterized membrane protein YqjE